MGYTKSQSAFMKVKEFLIQMSVADTDLEWKLEPNQDPARIAYNIRQGIKAAIQWNLPDFSDLGGKYIIRSKPGVVIAELRNKIPSEMFKQTVAKIVVRDVTELSAIVGAVITRESAEELYFPDVIPNNAMLEHLYAWAVEKKGYSIVVNETGITLTKKDVGDLAWKPQVQPQE